MYIHDATEVAYKNGYDQGVKDFAERLKTYYDHHSSRPLPVTVVYHIEQIQNDLLSEKENENC